MEGEKGLSVRQHDFMPSQLVSVMRVPPLMLIGEQTSVPT